MDTSEEVLEAARRRADALAAGDQQALRRLLHPQFRWVSHTGERFDRDSYVESTTGGASRRARTELSDVDLITHARTAVLRCEVLDEADSGRGTEQLRTPMTQVWVRYDDSWVCLVGHTDPSRQTAS